jgi:GMP synthase (glutamine-hydrolysing)
VSHQTIIVLDFGSRDTQLIARRLRELSVHSEIWAPDVPAEKIRARRPAGIILSGGPKSVSDPGAGAPAALFVDVPAEIRVWASHGDFVAATPTGFSVVATSANAPIAAMSDADRALHAILFHPEVVHTERGLEILGTISSKPPSTIEWE